MTSIHEVPVPGRPRSDVLARAACLVAVLGTLSGSAHPGGPQALWLDVPYIAQEKNGCGAACIAMLSAYWARRGAVLNADRGDAAEILRQLYSVADEGIRARDLERYLQESGFRTFAFAGEWPDLELHISKGRPLLVCTRDTGPRSRAHYMVVAGFDSGAGIVLVNDPARRKLTRLDRRRFEEAWAAAGHWTLLAIPANSR